MKKILVSLGLIVGLSGIIHGMEHAINQRNWASVVQFLGPSGQFETQLNILLNSQADLNSFGQNNHSNLLNMLLMNVADRLTDKPETKIIRANLRRALKELIRHDKLDPELQLNGKSVVVAVDEKSKGEKLLPLLCTICNEVYAEKSATASMFHTYQASASKLGFKRCIVKWTPLCLLVDSRVWAVVGVAVVASAIYKMCVRKSEQNDDVESEDDLQISAEEQK